MRGGGAHSRLPLACPFRFLPCRLAPPLAHTQHLDTQYLPPAPQRVAEGRGLSSEAVAAVAKGRVWTGQQAAALGLVDALGGLRLAVSMAKQEAGLPLDEGAVHIKHAYPDQRSELAAAVKKLLGNEEEWGGRDGQQAAAPAALAVLAAAAAAVGRPLTSGEAAVLQHLAGQLAGSGLAPQCVSLDAAMLAAAV